MKRIVQITLAVLVCLPLMVGAETISWTLPTTYTDGSTISAADKARIKVYLRGWKAGTTGLKTYFGEVPNGGTSWTDNVMVRMNYWAAQEPIPGWVALVPGDAIFVTASASITWPDANGNPVEYDGPETAPYAYTIPKPPAPTPSCNAPSGLTIRQ